MRISNAIDSRALGLVGARAQSAREAAIAASPGLVHWLDPDPDYFSNLGGAGPEYVWNARVGGSAFTSQFPGGDGSTAGALTFTTAFNSKATITTTGNVIFRPTMGKAALMPEDEWTVVVVMAVDDTVRRDIIGAIPDSLTESDPAALWLATINGGMRRYSNDASQHTRGELSVITAGQAHVLMYTWSAARGSGFFTDSGVQQATTISGSEFAALGVRSFKLFKTESGSGVNRFKGSVGDILIFGADYSKPAYAASRWALMEALGTHYGITITAEPAIAGITDPEDSTTGFLARTSPGARAARTITGTANQVAVANGAGVAGNPTLSLPNDIVLPGTGATRIVNGTTAQRPGTPAAGMLRFNTDTGLVEGYNGTAWVNVPAVPAAPGADRILFWDDSAAAFASLSLGTGVEISGTTLQRTDWTLIETGSLAGASTLIDDIPATYHDLMLVIDGASHDSGSSQSYSLQVFSDNGTTPDATTASATSVTMSGSTSAGAAPDFLVKIANYRSTSATRPKIVETDLWVSGATTFRQIGLYATTAAINALKVNISGGAFDGGTYYLMGR